MTVDFGNPALWLALLAIGGAIFAIGKWVGDMNSVKKMVGEAIVEIRQDIKRILGHLGPSTIAGQSPVSLTDLGQDILAEIEPALNTWAVSEARRFAIKLDKQSHYNIQEACFDFVRGYDFNPGPGLQFCMENAAYNNGTTIDQVKNVIAVYLRDAVLRIHETKSIEGHPGV